MKEGLGGRGERESWIMGWGGVQWDREGEGMRAGIWGLRGGGKEDEKRQLESSSPALTHDPSPHPTPLHQDL